MIYKNIDTLPQDILGGIICIGNFDGVHTGHQEIINRAQELSKKDNIPVVILTFWPHPRMYLRAHSSFLITPLRVKHDVLYSYNVKNIIELDFEQYSYMEAQDFIHKIIKEALRAKVVITGDNFKFGHSAKGDSNMLREELKNIGIDYMVVPKKMYNNILVSSSEIRKKISEGNMELANQLLGHDFYIEGEIMHGDQVARTLGCPTINLSLNNYVIPKIGIYTALVEIQGEDKIYNAVANLGYRPTLDGKGLKLEAHLFDFNKDVYGKTAKISLKHYLREEIKFENFEVLKNQIHQDMQNAEAWFAKK